MGEEQKTVTKKANRRPYLYAVPNQSQWRSEEERRGGLQSPP